MALAGSLVDFPLEGVLRLLESSRKTGVLEVAVDGDVGTLELTDGNLTAARYGDDVGDAALGAVFGMQEGSFAFRPSPTGTPNLAGSIDAIIARAIEERQRMLAIREAIPDDRMRFKHSERATSGGPITIAPEHWRVLMKVDGRRDVSALAAALQQGRVTTLRQLHELLDAGLVDALEPAAEPEPAPQPARTWSAPPPEPPRPVFMPPEPPPAPVVERAAPPPPVFEQPAPQPVFEAPRPAPVEAPAPPVFEAAPPPPAPAPEPAPAPAFWETHPPKPSSEDLSTLMQERLAAMQRQTPTPTTPEDFWQRMQTQAAAPAAPAAQAAPAAPPPASTPAAPAAVETPPQPAPAHGTDHRLAALFGRTETAEPPASAPVEERAPAPPPAPAPVAHVGPLVGEAPVASHYLPPDTTAPILEVEATQAPPKEEKKRGLLGGLFGGAKREAAQAVSAPEPTSFLTPAASAASSPGRLASFANALMTEYNSGQYGKQRLDERMNVRLRLVDEQADPLDRMLPVHDDRLDVSAIDRDFAPEQASPYLATLIRQIYEDAERLFGKDKAKKGYRAAIRNGLGGDESVLRDRSIVEVLPKL
jgi:hypothetical protein